MRTSERHTWEQVNRILLELGYKEEYIFPEAEKKGLSKAIVKCLGRKRPDFVYYDSEIAPSLVVVIECKGVEEDHESQGIPQLQQYVGLLAKTFDVVGIAISGKYCESITGSNSRKT